MRPVMDLCRISQVVLCAAAITFYVSRHSTAQSTATEPAERLASLLESVPADYDGFPDSITVNFVCDELGLVSNTELREAVRNADGLRLELCLNEAVRRGGKEWVRIVKERWEAKRKSVVKDGRDSTMGENMRDNPTPLPSIECLTAIRRLEGKPDPLQILVAGRRARSCSLGDLPRLFVLLTNLDIDRAEVPFTEGGDYRSGRQARWRLEVTDSQGQILPQRSHSGIVTGGGMWTEGTLQYGESWATELNIFSFVRIETPGTYKIRVLYHDHLTIADYNDLAGRLIMSASLPLELTVEPVTIDATRVESAAIHRAVSELPATGTVKFVEGTYDKSVHDFVAPDSPAGILLAMGWKAVPAMIDAAVNERVHPIQRAWLLALLGSVTRANDPRDELGVLGKCETRSVGWSVWGGTPGQMSGGLGWGGSLKLNDVHSEPIDPKRQLALAQKWQAWLEKEYVKVNVVEGEGR